MSSKASALNSIFEEKLTKGWLKSYYYGTLLLMLFIGAHALNSAKNATFFMKNPLLSSLGTEITWNGTRSLVMNYYDTRIYSFCLMVLALVAFILTIGFLFQFLAIKERDIKKQATVVKIANYFIGAQARAAGFTVFFTFFSAPISTISAFLFGLGFLAIGVGFKFLASNVQNIMLGKAEEAFKFDKDAFLKFKLIPSGENP